MATKEKKTSEEVKKAKALRIKKIAEQIYTNGIALTLNTSKSLSRLAEIGDNTEAARAYIIGKSQAWADTAITIATQFDSAWKKRKGEFLHDDV